METLCSSSLGRVVETRVLGGKEFWVDVINLYVGIMFKGKIGTFRRVPTKGPPGGFSSEIPVVIPICAEVSHRGGFSG